MSKTIHDRWIVGDGELTGELYIIHTAYPRMIARAVPDGSVLGDPVDPTWIDDASIEEQQDVCFAALVVLQDVVANETEYGQGLNAEKVSRTFSGIPSAIGSSLWSSHA